MERDERDIRDIRDSMRNKRPLCPFRLFRPFPENTSFIQKARDGLVFPSGNNRPEVGGDVAAAELRGFFEFGRMPRDNRRVGRTPDGKRFVIPFDGVETTQEVATRFYVATGGQEWQQVCNDRAAVRGVDKHHAPHVCLWRKTQCLANHHAAKAETHEIDRLAALGTGGELCRKIRPKRGEGSLARIVVVPNMAMVAEALTERFPIDMVAPNSVDYVGAVVCEVVLDRIGIPLDLCVFAGECFQEGIH